VIVQPNTYLALQRGVNQLADAIRPTLGPRPRLVAYDRGLPNTAPDLFDSGGVIARRIVALRDRDEDMGAMLLRGLLWRLQDEFGDGTATAALLFQSIFNQGVQYIAAGGNAMVLRQALDDSLPLVLDQLNGMQTVVRGQGALTRLAAALCYDEPLAKLLGEVFDTIGEYGQLEFRDGNSLKLDREYVEGSYWDGGLAARDLITDKARHKTVLENPAILISDLTLTEPEALEQAVAAALAADATSLILLATQFSEAVLAMIRVPLRGQRPLQIVPVKTPGGTLDAQMGALEDLAALTGGQPLLRAVGQTLAELQPDSLGWARVGWADPYYFGIVSGRGNPRALRQHISQLKVTLQNASDKATRETLQVRLGKLMGGSATVSIGGATASGIKVRKELAERSALALRGALREGVLPGGGAALLACRPALRARLRQTTNPDERAAYRILIHALAEPMRGIVANAGLDASPAVAAAEQAGAPWGYDAIQGQLADMRQAGILDVAPVLKAAVRGAVTTASLGLTIDVLVHQRRPQTELTPR
jgi:chaperonin GroEL